MDIDSLVNDKIQADADFQASLDGLDDTEKQQRIAEKTKEVLSSEFASLKGKADEAEKAKELAENYKRRAEKAENSPKQADKDGLSSKDVIFLAKTNINEEDVEEVTELAKLKKIPVSEAYNYLKPVLDVREEQRKTANATQTKGGRPAVKTTPDELINRANQGNLPEDDAGIDALTAAREAQRIGGK